ncbi:MAG: hypothetical protein HRT89_20550, partial [Lentisphaeria bacterium]|nr:hypothetical protein [Lentisphaeria bacterium]NQZ70450.1 hypothetical protein [Lentisphaeria bacterium]
YYTSEAYQGKEHWDTIDHIIGIFHILASVLNLFAIIAYIFYIVRVRPNPKLWKAFSILAALFHLSFFVFILYFFLYELDSAYSFELLQLFLSIYLPYAFSSLFLLFRFAWRRNFDETDPFMISVANELSDAFKLSCQYWNFTLIALGLCSIPVILIAIEYYG